MMKKIFKVGILILTELICILAFCGCASIKPDEAERYVQANLDLVFQGETKEALEFLDASESDLKRIHIDGIDAFVRTYIAEDMGATSGTAMYHDMVDEVFSVMKYRIDEAQENGRGKYRVPVIYHPVNLFPSFVEKLKEEAEQIEADAEAGKYEGTDEEIQTHMLLDYMTHSYGFFEDAYLSMEYGDEETFIFHVKKGENGIPELEEEEIQEFIRKIMMLDKI